jgi:hypothetical protein
MAPYDFWLGVALPVNETVPPVTLNWPVEPLNDPEAPVTLAVCVPSVTLKLKLEIDGVEKFTVALKVPLGI